MSRAALLLLLLATAALADDVFHSGGEVGSTGADGHPAQWAGDDAGGDGHQPLPPHCTDAATCSARAVLHDAGVVSSGGAGGGGSGGGGGGGGGGDGSRHPRDTTGAHQHTDGFAGVVDDVVEFLRLVPLLLAHTLAFVPLYVIVGATFARYERLDPRWVALLRLLLVVVVAVLVVKFYTEPWFWGASVMVAGLIAAVWKL